VSRTGEVITQGLSDVVFYLQLGAKGQVVNVPVPVAAFVPEILSLPGGPASYVERTSKIKNMQEDVVHIHDMLPSVASALSMPHAIALVMRLIFLIDTEILDPRKNESMSLFVKRSNKEGVAFSNWTTTDSGVRPIQRNKKSIRTFDANTLGGDEALEDFSPYASRYLAARTFVRLKLVHESNKNKHGGGGASSSSSSSVLAIVPAANQPLDHMLKDSLMAQNCLEYIRSMQYGHKDGSNVIENIYSQNMNQMSYKVNASTDTVVVVEALSFGSDQEFQAESREVHKLLTARVLRQMTVFPGSERLLCTDRCMNIVEARKVLVCVVKDASVAKRIEQATHWFSLLCNFPHNRSATDRELDDALDGLVKMIQQEIRDTCVSAADDVDGDATGDATVTDAGHIAVVPPFKCKVLEASKSLRPLLVLSRIKLDTRDVPASWVKLLEKYAHNVEHWGGSFGRGATGGSSGGGGGGGGGDNEPPPLDLTNIARMVFYCNQNTLKEFSPAHRNVESIIPSAMTVRDASIQDPTGADDTVPVLKIVNKKRNAHQSRRKRAAVSKKKTLGSVLDVIEEEGPGPDPGPGPGPDPGPDPGPGPGPGPGPDPGPDPDPVRMRMPGGGEDYPDTSEDVSS
jgi:hypothetical protein